MHLLTTPVIYRILTFQASPQRTRLVGIILTVLFTVVMVTHMVMDEFLLHATSFGLGVYIIATRVLKLIKEQVPDPHVRNRVRKIARFGVCKFFFAVLQSDGFRILLRLVYVQAALRLGTLYGCWMTGCASS